MDRKKQQEEEEDDPLDAYMEGIERQVCYVTFFTSFNLNTFILKFSTLGNTAFLIHLFSKNIILHFGAHKAIAKMNSTNTSRLVKK